MRFFFQILFSLIFLVSASAQSSKVVKARTLVAAGKTSKAISLLKNGYAKNASKEMGIELVRLFSQKEELDEALQWAQKIGLGESPTLDDAVLFADLLIQRGNYQQALDHCIKYALYRENAQPLYERAYTCENLLRAEKNSILFTIYKVPFNDFTDEISITNFRRHYVISSNKLWEAAEGNNLGERFDFYLLQKEYDKWRIPTLLLGNVDKQHNRTTLSYTPDGNFVYYTLSDYQPVKSKKKGFIKIPNFKIYQAISMGNKWVDPEPLPFQKEGVNYKDPAIHPNGRMLVFTSNIKGGEQTDLYISQLEGEQWSSPVELGVNVNSDADETMPYFDEDGVLYFSSNRKLGFGGYDIYQTVLDNGIWLRPQILAPPVNSAFDDLSFTRHYGRSGGYVVSNRPGGKGGYDIYEFKEIDLQLGVTVLKEGDGSMVELAEVRLLQDGVLLEQRVTNEKGLAVFRIGKNTQYDIIVLKDGFFSTESSVHTRAATEGRILYWNVKLPIDQSKQTAAAVALSEVDHIKFTAQVVDRQGNLVPNLSVRLINTSTMKMKIVETDEIGTFTQSLLLGNKYEFIMEFKGERYVGVFSTVGLEDMTPKTARYTIGEN